MSLPRLVVGGVPEHFNLPLQDDEIYRKHGVEVEFKEVKGGTGAMIEGLESGELNLALGLTESLFANFAQRSGGDKGSPLRLCSTFVESPLVWAVSVKADGPVKEIAAPELEKARVGVSRMGSGSHTMAFLMAQKAGRSGKDFSYHILQNIDGLRKGVGEGEVDCFMWETHMMQPFFDQGELRKIDEVPTLWPAFSIAVNTEGLTADLSKTIREKFYPALLEACAKFTSDRTAAVGAVVERFGLKPPVAEHWFDNVSYLKNPGELSKGVLEKVQDTLMEVGVLTEKVEFEKVVCADLTALVE